MGFIAYILRSETHATHYYGSTKDLQSRLKDHNSGRVRYTKGRKPWKIIYFEEYKTRSEAVRREMFFKSIEGYRFLKGMKII